MKTVTAVYDSPDKTRNAREDLISSGIAQEHIYVGEDKRQIKVMVPAASEPEITEILKRHQPDMLESHQTESS